MMKNNSLIITALLVLISCSEVIPEQETGREVNVSVDLLETKVFLSDDRDAFSWHDEDCVSIYNNSDNSVASLDVTDEDAVVTVPESAKMLYGQYPAVSSLNGPSSVTVSIPPSQSQTAGGVFPSENYPMAAAGTIVNDAATLMFRPLASALALNIYGGSGAVRAVRVTPLLNSGFVGSTTLDLTDPDVCFSAAQTSVKAVTVTMGTPVKVGVKPSDEAAKRGFPGQIYVCLARQEYTRLQIEVDTGGTIWKLTTSDSFKFDCVSKDIIITGVNLDKGNVEVDGVSGESFDVTGAFEKLSGSLAPLEYQEDQLDNIDRSPDFSRVGYKYGDDAIPSRPVVRTISVSDVAGALGNGSAADTTEFLQNVIDEVGAAGGGAILLKNGTYNVSRILFLDKNNVVLRGESQGGTIIKSNTTNQMPVVYMGGSMPATSSDTETSTLTIIAGRRVGITTMAAMGNTGTSSFGSVTIKTYSPKFPVKSYGTSSPIIDDYVPVGSLSVEVLNPELFSTGDKVCIYRPATAEWLADIGMDRIADNGRTEAGSPTIQWTEKGYAMRWTRVVTAVRGNRVYLDAPVAQALDPRYGSGILEKYTQTRVSGCGVENITFDCKYDTSVTHNGKQVDECHAWQAVLVRAAEHCWIRNVTSKHMGYALADLGNSARCITVENCTSLSPVSAVQGARRYAFCCSPVSELCLIKGCHCEDDRHSFVANGTSLGPNVFTGCTSTGGQAAIGPHYGWASCILWDCITADSNVEAQDGGCQGTGHGWRGMNCVFWNVNTTADVICHNVWGTCLDCGTKWNRTAVCSNCGGKVLPSGRNYTVGGSGRKNSHSVYWELNYYNEPTSDFFVELYGYDTNGVNRPDGEWYPARNYWENGGTTISLPYQESVPSWWPHLTLDTYSNPTSLYQCQLEDRHARGIYLNTL